MVKKACNNCTPQNCREHCVSDTCSRKNHTAGDMLFELLGFGTMLSRKFVSEVKVVVRKENT